MKTFSILLALILSALGASAQVQLTPVQFPILDLTGANANRTITLTPLDPPYSVQGTMWAGGAFTLQPVQNGCTNLLGQTVNGAQTNLVGGNWRLTFQGISKAVSIYVPFGFTNGIVASDPQYQRGGIVQVWNIYMTNGVAGGGLSGALLYDDGTGDSGILLFDP